MKISELFEKEQSNYFKKTYIIAEVAQMHDGSLGQAHAFIDALANVGIDAVKFQTHIAQEESSPNEPFRVEFSYEDSSRFDYWKRMEFSESQWVGLKKHADEANLDFLSSPFSKKAVEMLERIGVPAWKIGSGEIFDPVIIQEIIKTNKPIIFSNGMSTNEEIESQIKFFESSNVDFCLLECTTQYPTKANEIALGQLDRYKNEYGIKFGLSDHSGEIYPSLAAVTLGAVIIEVHVTFSPFMFGPDTSSSLTIERLQELVTGIRFVDEMINSKADKDEMANIYKDTKKIFTKSLYAAKDISPSKKIQFEDLASRKPNNGIASSNYHLVVGKKTIRPIKQGELLNWKDLK